MTIINPDYVYENFFMLVETLKRELSEIYMKKA